MKMIKKLDIASVARVVGLIHGGVYLIVGLLINIVVFVFNATGLKQWDFLGFGSGILASVLVALLVGVLGFLLGGIIAWLYNLAASIVGGIAWEEIEVLNRNFPKVEPKPDFIANAPVEPKNEEPRDTFTV